MWNEVEMLWNEVERCGMKKERERKRSVEKNQTVALWSSESHCYCLSVFEVF